LVFAQPGVRGTAFRLRSGVFVAPACLPAGRRPAGSVAVETVFESVFEFVFEFVLEFVFEIVFEFVFDFVAAACFRFSGGRF